MDTPPPSQTTHVPAATAAHSLPAHDPTCASAHPHGAERCESASGDTLQARPRMLLRAKSLRCGCGPQLHRVFFARHELQRPPLMRGHLEMQIGVSR